jgi:hypothetical protein
MIGDAESLKAEIIRCGRDPHYFINKYVKIQHPVRGLIPFKTFDYQDQLIDDYMNYRFNVILKARQLGISEISASYAVWLMLFHRNKNILVMASKAETAKNIIKKVKMAIEKLPPWLMIAEQITNNRLSVELSNGSTIKAIATSDDAGRSEALSLLIIDEAAFVKNLEELWTGLLPTVTAGGNIIVLSTPCGVGNLFHKLYTDAETGKNEFHPTKLMWWVHPDRIHDLSDDENRPSPHMGFPFFKTSSWYRAEIKKTNMSPREVAQELECNFNASGETFLDPGIIEELGKGTKPPNDREHWDRGLWTWWKPEPTKRYGVFADVARGDGNDYSACHVFDLDTMAQCAEYQGRIPVEEYAELLVMLGNRYNKALLVVENNNVGWSCLEHIRGLAYENVYYSSKLENGRGEAVHSGWGPSTSDRTQGFTTSQKLRPLVFSKMEEYTRNREIKVFSSRMYKELETFIWENGKPQAMKGWNDDLTMALALACWIKDTFISPGEQGAKLDAALINGMKVFGHTNTEINGASKDPEITPQASLGIFTSQNPVPTQIRLPRNRVVDFSWLYK